MSEDGWTPACCPVLNLLPGPRPAPPRRANAPALVAPRIVRVQEPRKIDKKTPIYKQTTRPEDLHRKPGGAPALAMRQKFPWT